MCACMCARTPQLPKWCMVSVCHSKRTRLPFIIIINVFVVDDEVLHSQLFYGFSLHFYHKLARDFAPENSRAKWVCSYIIKHIFLLSIHLATFFSVLRVFLLLHQPNHCLFLLLFCFNVPLLLLFFGGFFHIFFSSLSLQLYLVWMFGIRRNTQKKRASFVVPSLYPFNMLCMKTYFSMLLVSTQIMILFYAFIK